MSSTAWQRYFLPSFTFMSVVIGGGYATGRELVEFFMPAGPIGGLLGMGVTACVWAVIFSLSLELARSSGSYDYRAFFKQLLGPAWVLFEIAYLALLVLILAVLGAACGEIAADVLNAPQWTGVATFLLLIAALAWFGTAAIETFFSAWGALLLVAYAALMIVCLMVFGERIGTTLSSAGGAGSGWLVGGLTYAGYNIAVAPALLFCARHQRNRRETLIAGALAGPVAILPAIVFYIAMQARYPEIAAAPIPLQTLLRALDTPWLATSMQIAIFGTLVQTGSGILHGFNERLLGPASPRAPAHARVLRVAVCIALSLIALVLATRIGLVALIANGYGFIAWVVIAVYAVPLLTVGVWRIFRSRALQSRTERAEPEPLQS